MTAQGQVVAVWLDHRVHVVWPTLLGGSAGAEENLAVFYATSKDSQRFTKRQPSTTGVPRHPQLAVGPGGTITVAWDEQLKGTRRIVVAKGTSGDNNAARCVHQSVGEEPGTYPVVASLADAAIVAWTGGPTRDTVLRVERHPVVK